MVIDSYIPHHSHHYAGQKMEKQRLTILPYFSAHD